MSAIALIWFKGSLEVYRIEKNIILLKWCRENQSKIKGLTYDQVKEKFKNEVEK